MKYLIIYHKEDNDGLFSMAIIYNHLVNEMDVPKKDITLYGFGYDEMNAFGTENGIDGDTKRSIFYAMEHFDRILMTDMSFNDAKVMKKLYKTMKKNFVWIDHHAPIIAQSEEMGFDKANGYRNTKRSAILDAYHFFYDHKDKKYDEKHGKIELFRILSAYDSWTFTQEGYTQDYALSVSEAVNNKFFLNPEQIIDYVHELIYEMTPKQIEKDIEKFYEDGSSYLEITRHWSDDLVEQYGDTEWTVDNGKRTAIVMFLQQQTSSDMFCRVGKKYDHGIVFKHNKNGSWTISLYNTKDSDKFHCGEYMKNVYGGGGHVGAAGGQVDEKTFIKLLKNKAI